MPRQRKNPDYSPEEVLEELMNEVTALYLSGTESAPVSLRSIAEEFDMTILKIRKLLITAGVFPGDIPQKVNHLRMEGKSIPQIMEIMNLSRASVHSYLPYQRGVYNAKEISLDAERCRKYRERKQAQELLCEHMGDLEYLWNAIRVFEGYPFATMKGLTFQYRVKGNEIFISRKEKSITKSSVNYALEKVVESGGRISGPKKLGVFGASYLYPVFVKLGIINSEA